MFIFQVKPVDLGLYNQQCSIRLQFKGSVVQRYFLEVNFCNVSNYYRSFIIGQREQGLKKMRIAMQLNMNNVREIYLHRK